MSDIDTCPDIPDLNELRERARWNRAIDRQHLERGTPPWLTFGVEKSPNLNLAIKAAAALDLKECRWSREEIAEGLSVMLGRVVTLSSLDAVVSQTHPHRFHAEWIPAWTRITGSRRLLDLLSAACGLWVVDAEDIDLAQYARAMLTAEKLRKRIEVKI